MPKKIWIDSAGKMGLKIDKYLLLYGLVRVRGHDPKFRICIFIGKLRLKKIAAADVSACCDQLIIDNMGFRLAQAGSF
jgi:hypothetical protein